MSTINKWIITIINNKKNNNDNNNNSNNNNNDFIIVMYEHSIFIYKQKNPLQIGRDSQTHNNKIRSCLYKLFQYS